MAPWISYSPAQCAHADDLAFASSSFRDLMVVLAPAFRSIDYIAGLNLNFRKCCWVLYGNEDHAGELRRLFAKCSSFDTPKMLEQSDGYLHRWTAARKIRLTRDENERL